MATATAVREPIEAAIEVLKPGLAASEPSERIIAAKCMGLMWGYNARWANAPYLIESVERTVTSNLYNPETGRNSRSFRVAGKIDVMAREEGTDRYVIFDHKTTSEDISDPDSPYWRQLTVEQQATHYMLIEWLNARKVDYAIWDVVRKPGISPKLLTKKEQEHTYHTRKYLSDEFLLNQDDLDELAATGRETPRMYSARLALDCTIERPQWYFARRQVARLDAETLEYGKELWEHSQEILHARQTNRHARNSGACLLYGSPCKFLGICSGHDTVDSDKWRRREWVHPELPVLDGTGKDILTNSRIRTFQTCRRKHQLQYEMGIERVDAEEREALIFGTKFHEALEAYFLTLQSLQKGGQ